jgi:glucose-1-phosphate cytidylyltransferase
MKSLAQHGINEFVLCLGYKGWLIKEYFLNYRAATSDVVVTLGAGSAVEILDQRDEENWRVTLAETGEATMTGGRVAAIRKYVERDKNFILTYGDGVSDVDIGALLAFHEAHGKAATVTAVRPPGRFGEMRIEENRVTEFNEKPQATEGFINGGFFVLDTQRFWDFLSPTTDSVLELEPMRRLAQAGELQAFRHTGFWQPMDTMREYTLLNELWSSGRAPWKTWGEGKKR